MKKRNRILPRINFSRIGTTEKLLIISFLIGLIIESIEAQRLALDLWINHNIRWWSDLYKMLSVGFFIGFGLAISYLIAAWHYTIFNFSLVYFLWKKIFK